MKKRLVKLTAFVACFAILSLSVPGLVGAERPGEGFDFKTFIKAPAHFIASLLGFLPVIDNGVDNPNTDDSQNTNNLVRITGDLSADRVSDED